MADTLSTSSDGECWTKTIEPRRGFFDFPYREVWAYRDLIWMLARRDLSASYKQTVLGPLWFLVQPLLVTSVFSYLFGRMARLGTDDVPHYLFYMSGLLLWSFFADCVLKVSRVLIDNQLIFGRVYFPRLVPALATLLTSSGPMLVQFAMFLAGLILYVAVGTPVLRPSWGMLFVPLIFIWAAALALGIGCIVASLTKRFRDLAFGVQVGLQLWMFGSAVVFPISRIAPEDRWIFFLNPIVPMVESFRAACLGVSLVEPRHILWSAGIAVVVLVAGLLLFNRAEQTSMDTI